MNNPKAFGMFVIQMILVISLMCTVACITGIPLGIKVVAMLFIFASIIAMTIGDPED
jgi:hypothetical protein